MDAQREAPQGADSGSINFNNGVVLQAPMYSTSPIGMFIQQPVYYPMGSYLTFHPGPMSYQQQTDDQPVSKRQKKTKKLSEKALENRRYFLSYFPCAEVIPLFSSFKRVRNRATAKESRLRQINLRSTLQSNVQELEARSSAMDEEIQQLKHMIELYESGMKKEEVNKLIGEKISVEDTMMKQIKIEVPPMAVDSESDSDETV
jgi:hypothetical protein